MENINRFQLIVEGKLFNCEIDEQNYVWIIELDGSRSNYGQVRPSMNLEDAKEIAKQMIHASNKTKKG